MVTAFVFLYISNKLAANQFGEQPAGNNTSAEPDNQQSLTPLEQKIKAIEARTDRQVEEIIEQGQTAVGGITAEAQKKIEEAENREIMEKLNLRTPEQLEADEQRRAELEKMEQEINQEIRDRLPSQ